MLTQIEESQCSCVNLNLNPRCRSVGAVATTHHQKVPRPRARAPGPGPGPRAPGPGARPRAPGPGKVYFTASRTTSKSKKCTCQHPNLLLILRSRNVVVSSLPEVLYCTGSHAAESRSALMFNLPRCAARLLRAPAIAWVSNFMERNFDLL